MFPTSIIWRHSKAYAFTNMMRQYHSIRVSLMYALIYAGIISTHNFSAKVCPIFDSKLYIKYDKNVRFDFPFFNKGHTKTTQPIKKILLLIDS